MRYRVQRMPSDQVVTVLVNGARLRGHIVNVSQTGAALRDIDGARIGDRLELMAHSVRVSGNVVRAQGDIVGVQFNRALPNGDLGVLRRAVGGFAGSQRRAGSHLFREM